MIETKRMNSLLWATLPEGFDCSVAEINDGVFKWVKFQTLLDDRPFKSLTCLLKDCENWEDEDEEIRKISSKLTEDFVRCHVCQKLITSDEICMHKNISDRGRYWCQDCADSVSP